MTNLGEELIKAFKVDHDGKGFARLRHFVTILGGELAGAFEAFDRDGNGCISAARLGRVLTRDGEVHCRCV